MIGLDTNVLVRYLAQDDRAQSARASELIEQLTEAAPGFISVVTLVETYWVLRRAYRADQESLVATLGGLLDATEVVVEREETVRRAVTRAVGGADFADAMVSELGYDAGCVRTVTFDRRAAKLAGMELL